LPPSGSGSVIRQGSGVLGQPEEGKPLPTLALIDLLLTPGGGKPHLSTVGFLERHQKMVEKACTSGITGKLPAFFGLLGLSKGALPPFHTTFQKTYC
jgi:hypothetical protein